METEKKSNGALVGSIIVIIILIIGGIYFWTTKVEDKVLPDSENTEVNQETEQALTDIETQIDMGAELDGLNLDTVE